MNDIYQDITKRYLPQLNPEETKEVLAFLKLMFPGLKRINDPREVSDDNLRYESQGIVYHFESFANGNLMRIQSEGTENMKNFIVGLLYNHNRNNNEFWCYTVEDNALTIEKYSVPIGEYTLANINVSYYGADATETLLKGRDLKDVNIEMELSELSLQPDASTSLQVQKKKSIFGKNSTYFINPNTNEIYSYIPTIPFIANVLSLNLPNKCKEQIGKSK